MSVPSPLFSVYREGIEEIRIYGEIVVVDDRRVLFHTGGGIGEYPARSLLKPFQLLATGLVEKNHPLHNRVIAACGSTSATVEQVEQLKVWHQDGKKNSALKVPPSMPMDDRAREVLKQKGLGPETIYHTCYSKHLNILDACEKHGWSLEDYHSKTHPYHAKLRSVLHSLLGENIENTVYVNDGCQLPSPVLSLRRMALLYQRLAMGGSELETIQEGMLRVPQWVGGPGRKDTRLMQENGGKLIAKEGADGLLGICVLPTAEYPSGLGIIVKLLAGYLPNYTVLALSPIFERLKIKTVAEIPKGQTVEFHYQAMEKSSAKIWPRIWDVSPVLSSKTAVWPGDKPFKRTASMETAKGQHMTLSAIETTLHIGTHTDGPNHFEKTKEGIGEVPVEKYVGPAQVIEVKKGSGESITENDIAGVEILANKVLFKTGSFPDPNRFNEDFVSLSPSLIEYLDRQGVGLIGIDTPSIDRFDSKDMKTHLATAKAKMAILEGIILENIEPGSYELSALPLRIEAGDASPVRAILKKI
jgi:arylformamidase